MGIITEIQRFCTHDGPGVRTCVFLKGCPLHCVWCHNPETQQPFAEVYYNPLRCALCGKCAQVCPTQAHEVFDGRHVFHGELCGHCLRCVSVCLTDALESVGREVSVEEVIAEVQKDLVFYGKSGGMTLSGGEPMFQPEFTVALLNAARSEGINTCMETSGCAAESWYLQAAKYCDLFLWDIKDTDVYRHRVNTGADPDTLLKPLFLLDAQGSRSVLRCIMVRGFNVDHKHAESVAEIYNGLKNCEGVELLKYHPMGSSKMTLRGLPGNANQSWVPSEDELEQFKHVLQSLQVPVLEKL